ncbi:MAG: Ig-like domain-containing protein, partial [Patescibacteria group bacterium]
MKFSIFGWSVVAGFGVLLFTLIPHSTSAQTNRCFFYDPSWYSTQTSSSVITPSQTINIPYSTTASIFQKIPLNNGCYNPGGSTTISYTPSAIILGTEVLTLAGNDWNVETNNIRIDTIQPYAKTAAGTIRLNEDKIINYIDANKNANGVAQIQFRGYGGGNITGQPNIDTDLIPFTNCVKIGGSAIGRKIVFMRGNGWVSTATDLLAQSQAIKNQILATDPFKTYSDQLSFYVDLKKQNQPAALAGTAATVKSQSSCGTGAFEYIYLYTGTRGTFSFPGQGVSFLEYGNFTAANGPLIAVREIGKAVANLTDEQRNPTVTGNLPHETNCTTDPFVGFRDSATNHIYGSPTLTRCSFEKNTSGKIYYRANNESLMGGAFSVTQPTLPANKFNVVSCGYIVAAIKGDPLIKASALKYWPVCKTMKTANDGIPDVPPTPNIYNYDGHPVPGELTSIHVENSTPTGNSIQIKSDGDDSIYEITNLPSNNVGGIEFTFPQEITLRSSGEQYTLKTGSLNSDWSTEVEVKPRTSGPKNLTAKEKNRGEITLSWTVAKPAADIAIYTVQKKIKEGAGFTDVRDISRDSGEENTVVLKGYPPSASATFRVVAKYYGWSSYNNNSDYVSEPSNEVTITTMPQLKAPVLYALSGSENAIQLFWTTEDSEDVKQFILMEQKGTLSGSISTSNTQSFVHKNLTPGSEHCYSVYASINANNDSLESNVACATAGSSDVDGITMNQPGSTFTGTGSLSLSVPSNGSATPSSVNFYIDGQEVGTDTSQPWNSSFDSTNFTNGDHVGFAQINRPSQPPANTPGVPVKINNPLNVTKIENDVTPNNFIAYGSGFSATGNKIILTLSSNSLTSSKGSLFHDDIFSEFASVMNSDYGKLFAKILPTFSVTSQSQLAQAANSYEIPSLTSDGKRIRFAVPQSVPKGTYVVSIATPTSGPTATTFKINVADLTTTTITIPPGSSSSFLLTVQKTNDNNARGKVSGNSIDCGSACSVTLPAGTQVNLTATPTSNLSTFVGWNYDACGGQNPCSFILSGPTTVTADFEIGTREPLRTDIPVITEMVGQPNHSVPQGSVITVNGSGFSYPTFNKVI